jgi:hypothetical protein
MLSVSGVAGRARPIVIGRGKAPHPAKDISPHGERYETFSGRSGMGRVEMIAPVGVHLSSAKSAKSGGSRSWVPW